MFYKNALYEPKTWASSIDFSKLLSGLVDSKIKSLNQLWWNEVGKDFFSSVERKM